jgi:hypothetical protein
MRTKAGARRRPPAVLNDLPVQITETLRREFST